jgi:chromosome segregation ATPase
VSEPEPYGTETQVAGLLQETLAAMAVLRKFAVPPHDALPEDVHKAVRELRGRLDSAETLVQQVAGEKRRLQRIVRRLTAEADEVYDTELHRRAERAVTREFESAQDRLVGARVKASPLRREIRPYEASLSRVEQAEDMLRSQFFGLRDIRKELLTTLDSYLPWLHSLES